MHVKYYVIKLYRASYKFVLTGSGSATSPQFFIGDGRMIGVATENNNNASKLHTRGAWTRKVRFRNWYDMSCMGTFLSYIITSVTSLHLFHARLTLFLQSILDFNLLHQSLLPYILV